MTLGVPGSLPPGTQICVRCLMDATVPGVKFDTRGMCNHCRIHDKLDRVFPLGEEGKRRMFKLADKIRKEGKNKRYDCVAGVSGGRDTSYALYVIKRELGLRPLAVHYDNGWDSDVAKNNLRKLCASLDCDLHTFIADWDESRDLTNCTIRASVPYIDMTDDVGIAGTLYRSAVLADTRWIISSHSFREEGITPVKWMYIDGLYVRSLIKRFSKMGRENLKQFTKHLEVDVHHMLYWSVVKGIRIVNITNYWDDVGSKVERVLAAECGWDDTFQHHFDNEIFAIVYHYARHKFGIDWRIIELSAKIRTGVTTREEAMAELDETPVFENPEMLEYCLKKQGIPLDEYKELLVAPHKHFTDYPNYFNYLKMIKLPILLLSRLNVIPAHAYEKFFET